MHRVLSPHAEMKGGTRTPHDAEEAVLGWSCLGGLF